MKIFLLLSSLTIAFHSGTSTAQDCKFKSANIILVTPKTDNIINSYWQKGTGIHGAADRLYVNYKDGSIATIEHQYCSLYHFEVAYYISNKSSVGDIEKLTITIASLFSYSGIKDDTIIPALTDIKEKLQTKKFNPDQAIAVAANESNSNNQRVEYRVSYVTIEDSSLHKAALFVSIDVGGEQ